LLLHAVEQEDAFLDCTQGVPQAGIYGCIHIGEQCPERECVACMAAEAKDRALLDLDEDAMAAGTGVLELAASLGRQHDAH
jgi:hypothetical protein